MIHPGQWLTLGLTNARITSASVSHPTHEAADHFRARRQKSGSKFGSFSCSFILVIYRHQRRGGSTSGTWAIAAISSYLLKDGLRPKVTVPPLLQFGPVVPGGHGVSRIGRGSGGRHGNPARSREGAAVSWSWQAFPHKQSCGRSERRARPRLFPQRFPPGLPCSC